MKTIRTKQAKVQFAYFVQRYQHGIIAKDLAKRKVQFYATFSRCSCRRGILNSLYLSF